MLFSKEYVNYLARKITKKLIDGEFIETPDQGAVAERVHSALLDELTLEERNILSVAFKNVVGTRRAAWRVLSSIEKKENNKGNTNNVEKVKHYKS